MFDQIELGREFFEGLEAIDAQIVSHAAQVPCRHCGGPLHRGDYDRKPRAAELAEVGDRSARRFSLCCGQEGCRRRATPPSVRFLGRRVYWGAVMIIASMMALVAATAAAIQDATGIAARTTRRWLGWWRGQFLQTDVFVDLSGRMVPAVCRRTIPTSLLERFPGAPVARLRLLLGSLAPLTTKSLPDGAHFLRGLL
jgi:hypothetical protein